MFCLWWSNRSFHTEIRLTRTDTLLWFQEANLRCLLGWNWASLQNHGFKSNTEQEWASIRKHQTDGSLGWRQTPLHRSRQADVSLDSAGTDRLLFQWKEKQWLLLKLWMAALILILTHADTAAGAQRSGDDAWKFIWCVWIRRKWSKALFRGKCKCMV